MVYLRDYYAGNTGLVFSNGYDMKLQCVAEVMTWGRIRTEVTEYTAKYLNF